MTSPVKVAVPVALMVFTIMIVYGALEMSDSGRSALDIIWDMMYGKKENPGENENSQDMEISCTGSDQNGVYEFDEDRNCILKECDTGYLAQNNGCVKLESSTGNEAVDCVGDWSGTWNDCNNPCGGGIQTQSWIVATDEKNGGTCVERGQTKSQECNTQECSGDSVNCVQSEWSEWGECNSEGKRTRSRTTTTPALYGGTACGPLIEEEICSAVNCVQSEWSEWGECNSEGKRTRSRTTTTPALYGGTPCDSLIEEGTCPAVNCVQSGWTDSGTCNSSTGKQQQTRSITTEPLYGGNPCDIVSQFIDCRVDCEMNDWSAYGPCSKTCGTGTQSRTRTVKTAAQHSGTPCPTDTTQTQNCNTQGCPVNCVMNDWSGWSGCSRTCGTGTQSSTRTVKTAAQHGGTACPTVTTQTQYCNTQGCPANCVQSGWSGWSACYYKAWPHNAYFKNRSRTTTTAEINGGTCGPLTEEVKCTAADCAEGQYEFLYCNKYDRGAHKRKNERYSYTYAEKQINPCGSDKIRYSSPANCNSGIPSKCSDGSNVIISGGLKRCDI